MIPKLKGEHRENKEHDKQEIFKTIFEVNFRKAAIEGSAAMLCKKCTKGGREKKEKSN